MSPRINVRREFILVVYDDNSIAIETAIDKITPGKVASFFADDVIASTIISNLEELGEL